MPPAIHIAKLAGNVARTLATFTRNSLSIAKNVANDQQKIQTMLTQQFQKAQDGYQKLSQQAIKAAEVAARKAVESELTKHGKFVKDTLVNNTPTALKISAGFGAVKGAMSGTKGEVDQHSEKIELLKQDLIKYLAQNFLEAGANMQQIYNDNYNSILSGVKDRIVGKGKGSHGFIAGAGKPTIREDGSMSLADQVSLRLKAGTITFIDVPSWLGKQAYDMAYEAANAIVSSITEKSEEIEKSPTSHVEKLEQQKQAQQEEVQSKER
jgi:hypothetical protein